MAPRYGVKNVFSRDGYVSCKFDLSLSHFHAVNNTSDPLELQSESLAALIR